MKQNLKRYDLRERTTKFAESIIEFCKKIPNSDITRPLTGQLVRAGTSVGANYHEADNAISKKDFKHRISICKKEACESAYWIQIIVKAVPSLTQDARIIWREARELTLIFGAINRKKKSE